MEKEKQKKNYLDIYNFDYKPPLLMASKKQKEFLKKWEDSYLDIKELNKSI